MVEDVAEQRPKPCRNRWETLRAGGGAKLIRDAVRPVLRELIEAQARRGNRRKTL